MAARRKVYVVGVGMTKVGICMWLWCCMQDSWVWLVWHGAASKYGVLRTAY